MNDGAESFSVKRAQARPAVASRPAFQLVLAAWFAALLGVGSLLVPAALIERLVAISGVAVLVPAAAPPLGFTARATLVLAGAIIGTGTGLLLARRVAQFSRPETKALSMAQEPPRCRPIHASEELDEEGIAESARDDPPDENFSHGTGDSEEPVSMEESPNDERPQAMQSGTGQSLNDMGLMQLTARLGLALNERRSQLAARQGVVSRSPPALVASGPDFGASDAEEAALAVADFFAPANEAKALVAPASRDVH